MQRLFTAILLSLALVCSVGFTGCFSTWHVSDQQPTVHLRGTGKFGEYHVLYLSISNPTDELMYVRVACQERFYPLSRQRQIVRLAPNYDTRISFMVFDPGDWECFIE